MTKERLKVLIIDDEKDLCLLIKAYLSNLPDGLGWEKAENIIKDHPNIKLHLLSAYNPPRIKDNLPVTKVWEKPISLRDLDMYFS
jgi:two-component system OmpR family response regulator